MKAVVLTPRSVRLDLQRCELPVLTDELLTRIEVTGGSLREEHERRGRLSNQQLLDASRRLLEYASMLAAIGDDHQPWGAGAAVSVTTAMEVADGLVRACAREAVEHLAELLRECGGDRELRPAAAAAAAWVDTLVDLRHLDNSP